jgi:hypothetical protein
VKLLHVLRNEPRPGKGARSKSASPVNVKAPLPFAPDQRLDARVYMTIVIFSPMRYPRAHKEATRRRILEAASQAFREHGVAETGVDEVMRRAGLTHGGFYAHFRDKTELIAEACAAAFDAAVPNLQRIAAGATPAARARL